MWVDDAESYLHCNVQSVLLYLSTSDYQLDVVVMAIHAFCPEKFIQWAEMV